jgi:hypothetical protein
MIALAISVIALSVINIMHTREIGRLQDDLRVTKLNLKDLGDLALSTSDFSIKIAKVCGDMIQTDMSIVKALETLGQIVEATPPALPSSNVSRPILPWI